MAWTEMKRRSVQAYTLGLVRPVATGSVGLAARAMVAWLFAADSWPGPPAPAPDGGYNPLSIQSTCFPLGI